MCSTMSKRTEPCPPILAVLTCAYLIRRFPLLLVLAFIAPDAVLVTVFVLLRK